MTVIPSPPNLSTCAAWAEPADITETDPTQLNQTVLSDMLQAASDILFSLSGRQYAGACTGTFRPCTQWLARDHGRPIRNPMAGYNGWYGGWWLSGGTMYTGPGGPESECACNVEEMSDGTLLSSVDLGVFPLTGIEQILIDGQPVDRTSFKITDNRHLVRIAPDANTPNPGWPSAQNHGLTPDQPGTWEVTADYGTAPPILGKYACAELAYQLYLAITPGTTGCRLPGRIQSVARQGITAVMLDPMTFLPKKKTGLIVCDYFLTSVNPAAISRRATVWSPDIGRRVRRDGPIG